MTAAPSPDQPGAGPTAADLTPGRPILFRNATVLTIDDAHRVLRDADVLINGDRIAEVGDGLQVPEGTAERSGSASGVIWASRIALACAPGSAPYGTSRSTLVRLRPSSPT